MKTLTETVFLAVALAIPPAYAGESHELPAAAASQASAPISDGEVRKVDREAKKITIKHGPLANLDMPPMTMVFQVRDPALLDKVKAGDKVKFRAEKEGSVYLVTHIER
jgi:Cu/Ag efflux protein CusF